MAPQVHAFPVPSPPGDPDLSFTWRHHKHRVLIGLKHSSLVYLYGQLAC